MFFESAEGDQLQKFPLFGVFVMVARISFGLLIATSLALTAYFGTAAWRLCNDQQNDTSGWRQPFKLTTP